MAGSKPTDHVSTHWTPGRDLRWMMIFMGLLYAAVGFWMILRPVSVKQISIDYSERVQVMFSTISWLRNAYAHAFPPPPDQVPYNRELTRLNGAFYLCGAVACLLAIHSLNRRSRTGLLGAAIFLAAFTSFSCVTSLIAVYLGGPPYLLVWAFNLLLISGYWILFINDL